MFMGPRLPKPLNGLPISLSPHFGASRLPPEGSSRPAGFFAGPDRFPCPPLLTGSSGNWGFGRRGQSQQAWLPWQRGWGLAY